MWRARHKGPRTPSRTTDANVDCAFVENALVFVVPKIGWAQAPLILIRTKTSAFSTNAQSKFASVVPYCVLGPTRLARHT